MLTHVETSKEKVFLRNVRILDVKKGELGKPANVLVEGNVIRDIDATSEPAGCDTIDAQGWTLSPGLINCHAHILSPYLSSQDGIPGAWTLKQIPRNFEACIAAGVVCVKDMLSPIKIMNSFRKKIASGKLIGPDIMASGALLSCKGGYPEFINPVPFPLSAIVGEPKLHLTTAKKAEAMVRYLKSRGADHIKVGYTSYYRDYNHKRRMPTVSDEVLSTICKTAHELGLLVNVHHNWSEDLSHLLEFDIDSLEHLIFDRLITDEEIAAIKKKGVAFVPTLTVTDSMARFEEKLGYLQSDRAREMFEEPARQHLLWISSTWLEFKNESYDKAFGFWRANRNNYAVVEDTCRRIIDAGIPILAGTDLGAVVAWPGEMADELIRLNNCGMSKHDAIKSATLDAARFVGRSETLGAVEPGKHADVMLVEGNPLEDLHALRRVRLVGKSGRWFKPKHPELPDFWPGHSITFKK